MMAYDIVACSSICIVFLTLAWISVGLRVYVRMVMKHNAATDDFLAISALVLLLRSVRFQLKQTNLCLQIICTGLIVLYLTALFQYHMGKHADQLTPKDISQGEKAQWISAA